MHSSLNYKQFDKIAVFVYNFINNSIKMAIKWNIISIIMQAMKWKLGISYGV